jgi:hypothetical protein
VGRCVPRFCLVSGLESLSREEFLTLLAMSDRTVGLEVAAGRGDPVCGRADLRADRAEGDAIGASGLLSAEAGAGSSASSPRPISTAARARLPGLKNGIEVGRGHNQSCWQRKSQYGIDSRPYIRMVRLIIKRPHKRQGHIDDPIPQPRHRYLIWQFREHKQALIEIVAAGSFRKQLKAP